MRFICHGRTEPELNLALEEILLTTNHDDVFMLWQNSPSVIIGRNQNAHCEVDREYIQNHDHTCPSMLGFVKSFCGISDFFLKILPFQSKFPLPHALMSCKAIYF